MARKGSSNYIMQIEGDFTEGVYDGHPDMPLCEITLRDFKGGTSLSHLESTGDLRLINTSITEAPGLRRVNGLLYITGTKISEFPELLYCSHLTCNDVPFSPKLTVNTIVEYGISDKDDANANAYNLYPGGLAYYGKLVEEVNETRGDMLVLLRAQKPHLKYLIDRRLRGED